MHITKPENFGIGLTEVDSQQAAKSWRHWTGKLMTLYEIKKKKKKKKIYA